MVISDSDGGPVLDVTISGGGCDFTTGVGWKKNSTGMSFSYLNRGPTPIHGITKVSLKPSTSSPGVAKFSVAGRDGAYPIIPARLPLKGTFVVDPPVALTGQCGESLFPGQISTPTCTFGSSNGVVKCR